MLKGMKLLGVPFVVWLIVSFAVGSVFAFTVITLSPIKISMWRQGIEASDFTVSAVDVKPKRVSVKVEMTLINGGDATHSANVTVSLYDSNNNILTEKFLLTGNVEASDSVSLKFEIAVDISEFDDLDITVAQLS